MKKDIFKIDNYLIGFGIFLLVVGGLTTFLDPRTYNDLVVLNGSKVSFENYEGRTLEQVQKELGSDAEIIVTEPPLLRPIIGISGLILLIIGIVFRKKENKIHSIWDALEKTSEGKVRDLAVSLGLSRKFILDNLKHINAQQGAYYVYISANDTIMDGELLEEHIISIQCSGCGNNINKKVSLTVLEELHCPYCAAAIPVGELSKLRSKIVQENKPWIQPASNAGMSIPIFIILLIFFWPGAIIYFVVKKNSSSKQIANLMTTLQKVNQ